MDNGWIKIHRKILEWEWFDDHNTFRLFMYLMMTCNFKPTKWRGVNLEIGLRVSPTRSLFPTYVGVNLCGCH